ncbi:MAG: diguanylate cyclase [Acidobacteria bacterium]|nr:diguanylate cyclase [Acidobacteriota bacterium]
MVSLFRSVKIEELQKHLEQAHRVIGLLLEGVRLNAICTSQPLLDEFQVAMREHEETANQAIQQDPRGLLLAVGGILRTMQMYAKQSETTLAGTKREYQQITGIMARALARVFVDNDQVVAGLGSVEQRLEAVSRVDDIRTIKSELEGCLRSVQAECQRQERLKQQLKEAAAIATEHPLVVNSFDELGEDPVTGLPSAEAADQMLRETMVLGEDFYIAVLRLDSLQLIINRYGQASADSFLMEGSVLLAQGLTPDDTLFRWRGSCMLALLRRRKSLEAVRAEMDRLVARMREQTVTFDKRSVLFKVAISALCLRSTQWASAGALLEQMEGFAVQDRGRS